MTIHELHHKLTHGGLKQFERQAADQATIDAINVFVELFATIKALRATLMGQTLGFTTDSNVIRHLDAVIAKAERNL